VAKHYCQWFLLGFLSMVFSAWQKNKSKMKIKVRWKATPVAKQVTLYCIIGLQLYFYILAFF